MNSIQIIITVMMLLSSGPYAIVEREIGLDDLIVGE
jgi:hypothetical protein